MPKTEFILNENVQSLLKKLHAELLKKYGNRFYEEYKKSSICISTENPSQILLNIVMTYNQNTKQEEVFEQLKKDVCEILEGIGLSDCVDQVVIVGEFSPESNW
jgi:hypothetical protein